MTTLPARPRSRRPEPDINAPPPSAAGGRRRRPDAAVAANTATAAAPPKRRRRTDATASDLPACAFTLPIVVEGDALGCTSVQVRAQADNSAPRGGPTSTSATTTTTALVVTGLPFTWRPAADILRAVMSAFGPVVGVAVDGDARSGVVLFGGGSGGATGVKAVLAAAAAGRPAVAGPLPPLDAPIGLKSWVEEHKSQFPGTEAVKEEVDAWMAAYDAEEARKAAAVAAAAAEESDGWTVVTRGGGGGGRKNRATAPGGTSVGVVAPAVAAARAAAKAVKVDTDFYRFQKRDARRQELTDLRAKFEEDKRRIAELRASRRFRPG